MCSCHWRDLPPPPFEVKKKILKAFIDDPHFVKNEEDLLRYAKSIMEDK